MDSYKNIIILLLVAGLGYSIYSHKSAPVRIECNRTHCDNVNGQPNPVKDKESFHTCNYFESKISEFLDGFTLSISDAQTKSYLDTIMRIINLPQRFQLNSSINIDNACAYIDDKKKKRFIVYNKDFLDKVKDSTQTRWSVISILAHEVGHHLSGHTLKPVYDSINSSELEADKFSGFILGRLGATKEESISAMKKFGSENGSKNHPPMSIRIAAILDGWTYASYRYSINSKDGINFIPDTSVTIIPDEEIKTFLKNWRKYQNNKEFNESAFDKYSNLYSMEFSGIRRVHGWEKDTNRITYCNRDRWLKTREKTYKSAKNLVVSYSDVHIVDQDNNGITIQFTQTWSTNLYEETGEKIMKLYKNKTDHKTYIVFENMLNPRLLYTSLNEKNSP